MADILMNFEKGLGSYLTKDQINLQAPLVFAKAPRSQIVAENLAKKAKEKKITKIYFDRGIYKYHGRVKTFADTLRKNGMEF